MHCLPPLDDTRCRAVSWSWLFNFGLGDHSTKHTVSKFYPLVISVKYSNRSALGVIDGIVYYVVQQGMRRVYVATGGRGSNIYL